MRSVVILLVAVALVAIGCDGQAATRSPVSSGSPTTAASTVPSVNPSVSPSVTWTAKDPCPTPPVDFATVAAVAEARRAIECFDGRELVLTGFVPVTEGLGGTNAADARPRWLADSFSGAILQPDRQGDPGGADWFAVKVAPSLGKCFVTGESDKGCPFAPYLGKYVAVAGHFDDPAAKTCVSRARTPGGYPGPSKAAMVRACRREFVVTALGPTTGP